MCFNGSIHASSCLTHILVLWTLYVQFPYTCLSTKVQLTKVGGLSNSLTCTVTDATNSINMQSLGLVIFGSNQLCRFLVDGADVWKHHNHNLGNLVVGADRGASRECRCPYPIHEQRMVCGMWHSGDLDPFCCSRTLCWCTGYLHARAPALLLPHPNERPCWWGHPWSRLPSWSGHPRRHQEKLLRPSLLLKQNHSSKLTMQMPFIISTHTNPCCCQCLIPWNILTIGSNGFSNFDRYIDFWSTAAAMFSVAAVSTTGLGTEKEFLPMIAHPIE